MRFSKMQLHARRVGDIADQPAPRSDIRRRNDDARESLFKVEAGHVVIPGFRTFHPEMQHCVLRRRQVVMQSQQKSLMTETGGKFAGAAAIVPKGLESERSIKRFAGFEILG